LPHVSEQDLPRLGYGSGVAASGFAALVCTSGHLARSVPDTAHEAPGLSAITGFFKWEQGQPPHPPTGAFGAAALWVSPRDLIITAIGA
jgi:hypothetical protein